MDKILKDELKELKRLARHRLKKGSPGYKQAYCFLTYDPRPRGDPDSSSVPDDCVHCGAYHQCLLQKILYLENKELKERLKVIKDRQGIQKET